MRTSRSRSSPRSGWCASGCPRPTRSRRGWVAMADPQADLRSRPHHRLGVAAGVRPGCGDPRPDQPDHLPVVGSRARRPSRCWPSVLRAAVEGQRGRHGARRWCRLERGRGAHHRELLRLGAEEVGRGRRPTGRLTATHSRRYRSLARRLSAVRRHRDVILSVVGCVDAPHGSDG